MISLRGRFRCIRRDCWEGYLSDERRYGYGSGVDVFWKRGVNTCQDVSGCLVYSSKKV